MSDVDPRLEGFHRLNEPRFRRQYEHEHGVFVAEGPTVLAHVSEVAPHLVRSVLVDAARPDRVPSVLGGAEVVALDRAAIAEVVGFDFHRGVLALCDRPPPSTDLVGHDSLVVVEGVNDHENLGAIIRAAAGLGADGVLLDPTTADPWYRRSVRVSMGTVLDIPLIRSSNWLEDLERIRSDGMALVASAPTATADVAEVDVDRPAIAIGAEGAGLSDELFEKADIVVSIPMRRGIDSLNVGQAAAVLVDRLVRRSGDR